MKTLSRSGLITALCLAVLLPVSESSAAPKAKGRATTPKSEPTLQAAFSMNPPELSPASTIEIVFPTPMISKELVGSTAAESPLMTLPCARI
jgi:hypothetical protein